MAESEPECPEPRPCNGIIANVPERIFPKGYPRLHTQIVPVPHLFKPGEDGAQTDPERKSSSANQEKKYADHPAFPLDFGQRQQRHKNNAEDAGQDSPARAGENDPQTDNDQQKQIEIDLGGWDAVRPARPPDRSRAPAARPYLEMVQDRRHDKRAGKLEKTCKVIAINVRTGGLGKIVLLGVSENLLPAREVLHDSVSSLDATDDDERPQEGALSFPRIKKASRQYKGADESQEFHEREQRLVRVNAQGHPTDPRV